MQFLAHSMLALAAFLQSGMKWGPELLNMALALLGGLVAGMVPLFSKLASWVRLDVEWLFGKLRVDEQARMVHLKGEEKCSMALNGFLGAAMKRGGPQREFCVAKHGARGQDFNEEPTATVYLEGDEQLGKELDKGAGESRGGPQRGSCVAKTASEVCLCH